MEQNGVCDLDDNTIHCIMYAVPFNYNTTQLKFYKSSLTVVYSGSSYKSAKYLNQVLGI